jgi:hypothetical protein
MLLPKNKNSPNFFFMKKLPRFDEYIASKKNKGKNVEEEYQIIDPVTLEIYVPIYQKLSMVQNNFKRASQG